MELPLEGITIVSLEQAVSAPFATRHLADLGARVIKVERPGTGDFARHYDQTVRGQSSHFVWLNRSKESITLDLKQEAAREILGRLLEDADVFIQNLAPGAAARLGLGAEQLRARHPRLIIGAISGYGGSGPYADRKAYDLLIQCEAGVLSITGTDEVPSKAGIAVADIASGMYLFSGILAALLRRARTGCGAVIEVSMLEALGEWMGFPAYYTAYGGRPLRRSGGDHASIAPYGPHRVGDGSSVFLAVQNDGEWQRMCEQVLGRPELSTDPRFSSGAQRVAHRDVVRAMLEDAFAQLTFDQVLERLHGARIACARMNAMEDFWRHPQLEARGRWRTVESPGGALRQLLPPVTMDGLDPRMDAIPDVGQQTDEILRSLGYGEQAIARLRGAQAI